MSGADTILEVIFQRPPKIAPSQGAANRLGFILLQTLVTIVLCYELLFSGDAVLPSDYQQPLVAVLMLINAVLIFLPIRVLEAEWFPGALVMGDTGLTTAIIYLSGNASSDLYVTYFLILLIAAFSTSLNQLIGLSVVPCTAYGMLLVLEIQETGSLSESHLLRIPILLIMATFYGVFTEMIRNERKQKAGLIDYIAALKQAEQERERLIRELQDALANIKTLSGLLPICFSCKQIRDDKGYWNQIDTYVLEHTDAEVTHSICPTCAQKLYPDLHRGGQH